VSLPGAQLLRGAILGRRPLATPRLPRSMTLPEVGSSYDVGDGMFGRQRPLSAGRRSEAISGPGWTSPVQIWRHRRTLESDSRRMEPISASGTRSSDIGAHLGTRRFVLRRLESISGSEDQSPDVWGPSSPMATPDCVGPVFLRGSTGFAFLIRRLDDARRPSCSRRRRAAFRSGSGRGSSGSYVLDRGSRSRHRGFRGGGAEPLVSGGAFGPLG
jgi:hypothetical protein